MFARFNSLFCLAAALAILACASQSANAALATWSFGGTGSDTTNPFDADTGTRDAFLSSATLNFPSRTGVTLSVPSSGGQSGGYLSLVGNAQNIGGQTFTFTLQASGGDVTLNSLTFFYQAPGGKPPTSITWVASIGSNPSATTLTAGANWNNQATVNFSSVQILSGNSFTLTGTIVDASSGSGGDIFFDTINFNGSSTPAVPEPAHYALALFGVAFVGTTAARGIRRFKAKA